MSFVDMCECCRHACVLYACMSVEACMSVIGMHECYRHA